MNPGQLPNGDPRGRPSILEQELWRIKPGLVTLLRQCSLGYRPGVVRVLCRYRFHRALMRNPRLGYRQALEATVHKLLGSATRVLVIGPARYGRHLRNTESL
jgi:hypothetical protein